MSRGAREMNHYCTYFDRGFLAQGLALWRSLGKHDLDSVLWVLALDEFMCCNFDCPCVQHMRLI